MIQLDRTAPGSLVENLKSEILRRSVWASSPGRPAPPTRRLAHDLGVHRGTVTAAYEALRREGVLAGHVGRGTFVAIGLALAELGPTRQENGEFRWPDHFAGFEPPVEDDSVSAAAVIAADRGRHLVRRRRARPGLFPTECVPQAINEVLREEGSALLAYGPRRDTPASCASCAGIWREGRRGGGDEELLVVNGSQQALDLIARAFLRPGDTVLVEEPSYYGALDLFRGYGARLVGVPVDADGLRVDALETILARERPKLVYVMPTFQNPTGGVHVGGAAPSLVRLSAATRCRWWRTTSTANSTTAIRRRRRSRAFPAARACSTSEPRARCSFRGCGIGWIAARGAGGEAASRASAAWRISRDHRFSRPRSRGSREPGGLDRHMQRVREAYGERVRRLLEALDAPHAAGRDLDPTARRALALGEPARGRWTRGRCSPRPPAPAYSIRRGGSSS